MTAVLHARPDGTPLVKICGLRRAQDVDAAIDAGANLVGIVFAPSRRRMTSESARALVDAVAARLPVVGVFVDSSPADVARIAGATGIDIAQLSGSEDPSDFTAIGLPVIKTAHTGRGGPMDQQSVATAWQRSVAAFIVDAWSQQGGGSGALADWSAARTLIASMDCPVILAGGLSPENAKEAVLATRPFGVDVSSGVERDGFKDAERIRQFVRAVRTAGVRSRTDSTTIPEGPGPDATS